MLALAMRETRADNSEIQIFNAKFGFSIKGALDKYNIYLFISSSIEDLKSNQYRKFQAVSANAFSFYEVFCEQHHLQSAP